MYKVGREITTGACEQEVDYHYWRVISLPPL
jgi:hypothetical protein